MELDVEINLGGMRRWNDVRLNQSSNLIEIIYAGQHSLKNINGILSIQYSIASTDIKHMRFRYRRDQNDEAGKLTRARLVGV